MASVRNKRQDDSESGAQRNKKILSLKKHNLDVSETSDKLLKVDESIFAVFNIEEIEKVHEKDKPKIVNNFTSEDLTNGDDNNNSNSKFKVKKKKLALLSLRNKNDGEFYPDGTRISNCISEVDKTSNILTSKQLNTSNNLKNSLLESEFHENISDNKVSRVNIYEPVKDKNILDTGQSINNQNDCNDTFISSGSESLSQLCKSSQFIRQIENALLKCNTPKTTQGSVNHRKTAIEKQSTNYVEGRVIEDSPKIIESSAKSVKSNNDNSRKVYSEEIRVVKNEQIMSELLISDSEENARSISENSVEKFKFIPLHKVIKENDSNKFIESRNSCEPISETTENSEDICNYKIHSKNIVISDKSNSNNMFKENFVNPKNATTDIFSPEILTSVKLSPHLQSKDFKNHKIADEPSPDLLPNSSAEIKSANFSISTNSTEFSINHSLCSAQLANQMMDTFTSFNVTNQINNIFNTTDPFKHDLTKSNYKKPLPASNLENSIIFSTNLEKAVSNVSRISSIFNDTDPFNDDRAKEIYKKQLHATFDNLETSILSPGKNMENRILSNITNQSINIFNTTDPFKDELAKDIYKKQLHATFDNLETSILSPSKNLGNNVPDIVENQSINIFNATDPFKEDLMHDKYKNEVQKTFNNLETTIVNVPDNNLNPETSENIMTEQMDWENDSILKNTMPIKVDDKFVELGPFYGLPLRVMQLIQQFRGIEKLYDWQDECLKLDAIKKRKNLVYSLPTSGGKTLVSEILIMREILCRKHNALLVLPYVAIVQEKLWGFSPFAVSLDFLVEEYAAGKGKYPPQKRRHKKTAYVATIEKALGIVNSLLEVNRLDEIGLVVIDELHLVGEEGRGTVLESLITKILYAKKNIQIIGMSATIGNLCEICRFLNAEIFTKNFRPVELEEYVQCGSEIALIRGGELISTRKVNFGYSEQMLKVDPNCLGGLVMEVVPNGSCLVFCPTKKNCENVALLLIRVMNRELINFKKEEKEMLIRQFQAEGVICEILKRTLPYGVAYHHSGLTMDERRLIEDAFRAGTIWVICCTSTLAAGVNLPAKRVILRSPYVGLEFINLSRYKQMVGRAGRAGYAEVGESILVCEKKDLPKVMQLLSSPMDEAVSQMSAQDSIGMKSLILSCIGLGVATTRRKIHEITKCTLMSVQEERLGKTTKSITDQVITELFKQGALQADVDKIKNKDVNVSILLQSTNDPDQATQRKIVIKNDTPLAISKLGKAAIKGGLDLDKAKILYDDLVQAQASLVLLNCLHLLYLVTPYELVNQMKPQPIIFYNVYIELNAKELQTARVLGITEACAVNMMSGRPIRSVPERVLNRFYLTLMLNNLWNSKPVAQVAEKFKVPRGTLQQLMTSAATFSGNVVHFCDELDEFWPFADMLRNMTVRLQYCSSKELLPLMELPLVKLGRAKQLYNSGFKTLQIIARANVDDLAHKVENISRKVASQLIAAAKMLLLEKVENLREEAEDVLEGISH